MYDTIAVAERRGGIYRVLRMFILCAGAVALLGALLVACSMAGDNEETGGQDTTAPSATLSVSETDDGTNSTITLAFTGLDEDIAEYWWVLVSDDDEPDEMMIRAGLQSDGTAALASGTSTTAITKASPMVAITVQVSGLPIVGRDYEVSVVIEDAGNNARVLTAGLTVSMSDTTAPSATFSANEVKGDTGSDITFDITRISGTIAKYWWVVVPDNDTPDEDNVKAGQQADGMPAIAAVSSTDAGAPPLASGTVLFDEVLFGGRRLANGIYDIFLVVANAAGNSALLDKVDFFVDATAPVLGPPMGRSIVATYIGSGAMQIIQFDMNLDSSNRVFWRMVAADAAELVDAAAVKSDSADNDFTDDMTAAGSDFVFALSDGGTLRTPDITLRARHSLRFLSGSDR